MVQRILISAQFATGGLCLIAFSGWWSFVGAFGVGGAVYNALTYLKGE